MSSLSLQEMRGYLSESLSSFNSNKLNGLKAEIDFRAHLQSLGFGDRVSPGGWILRNTYIDFAKHTIALFPHVMQDQCDYSALPDPATIPVSLHTICSTLYQIGIQSHYCFPHLEAGGPSDIKWKLLQLGVPYATKYKDIDDVFAGFKRRTRRHKYLRYAADTGALDADSVRTEFSKENLRVYVSSSFMSEGADIDGVLWGQNNTYPVEIKEKTIAVDNAIGEFFGLDVNPFVKMAFYAAKKGNFHSIFVVREIDSINNRSLKNWWFTTFDRLAKLASWQQIGGGKNMMGGSSTVIRIPKAAFSELTVDALGAL
jgi:hypothetical protein